jgi:serine/threonine-protein kinase
LFQAAGLDFSKFSEVSPQWTPAAAFDARKAWKGTHPAIPEITLTVEAAAWRGKIMDVQLIWPWTKPTLMTEDPVSMRQIMNSVIGITVGTMGIFFCIWLARRNLKSGKGDRQGAWRIATTYFLLKALSIPAEVHFVPDGSSAELLINKVATAAFWAGMVWLLYIGLEPVIRGRWPQSIVTWSRVLSNQFFDPVLGSHVLYGVVTGVVLSLTFLGVAAMSLGGIPPAMTMDPEANVRAWVGAIAINATGALTTGMVLMFLIFGIRYLARRDWLAAGIAGILLALQNTAFSDGDMTYILPMMLAIYWGLMFLLMRIGMVATTVGVFTTNILLNTPATLDPQAWYTLPSYLRLAMVAAIALFGFYTSRGDGTQAESA